MKLRKLTSIIEKNEGLSKDKFEYYLNALDNFKLTTIYKLSGISKSVILSYFLF